MSKCQRMCVWVFWSAWWPLGIFEGSSDASPSHHLIQLILIRKLWSREWGGSSHDKQIHGQFFDPHLSLFRHSYSYDAITSKTTELKDPVKKGELSSEGSINGRYWKTYSNNQMCDVVHRKTRQSLQKEESHTWWYVMRKIEACAGFERFNLPSNG